MLLHYKINNQWLIFFYFYQFVYLSALLVQIRVSVRHARECKVEQEPDNCRSAAALSDIMTVVSRTVRNAKNCAMIASLSNPANNVSELNSQEKKEFLQIVSVRQIYLITTPHHIIVRVNIYIYIN